MDIKEVVARAKAARRASLSCGSSMVKIHKDDLSDLIEFAEPSEKKPEESKKPVASIAKKTAKKASKKIAAKKEK